MSLGALAGIVSGFTAEDERRIPLFVSFGSVLDIGVLAFILDAIQYLFPVAMVSFFFGNLLGEVIWHVRMKGGRRTHSLG